MAIDIAIVGVGEIARNQHIPSITRNSDYNLAAAVSRNAEVEGVRNFSTIEDLIEHCPDVTAVSLCMPPHVRFDAAWAAINAGKHVMLEKPPGASVSEVEELAKQAAQVGVTLFATWHSRHAPAVEPARQWLAGKTIKQAKIIWREDVRKWHPGQQWIWQAGGMGVFDPGINALSIFTHIMPHGFHVTSAVMEVPENCETPIGVQMQFRDRNGTPISAEFDWRQEGDQFWNIEVETTEGQMTLSEGGSILIVDGEVVSDEPEAEYDGLYQRFQQLIADEASDVDVSPLQQIADISMIAKRKTVEAFFE